MGKLAFIVAVSLTPLLAATLPSSDAADNEPTWHRDYQEARTLAKQTGKPLFVTFR